MELKLTNEGRNVLLSSLIGNAQINFTALVIGAGADAGSSAMALSSQKLAVAVDQDDLSVEGGFAKLEVTFNNSGVQAGFRATEMGVLIVDPDNSQKTVLYAYGHEPDATADYIAAGSDQILETQMGVLVYVGNAQNITAAISQSMVYAAKDHTHDAADVQTGCVAVPRGGTGKGSWTTNGIVFASGTGALSQVSVPENESVLIQKNGVPYWMETAKMPKQAARITVGTSTAGWTKANCDYLCDGSADQVEINAALAAVRSSGGKVLLLDGTYNISGNITMAKAGTELCGAGGTLLVCEAATVSGEKTSYFIMVTADKCTIRNMTLQGRQAASYYESFHLVCVNRCDRTTITEVRTINGDIFLQTCTNSIVKDNFVGESNGYNRGLRLNGGAGNAVTGNNLTGAYYGIEADGESGLCISGNVSAAYNEYGVYCVNCDGVTIIGNALDTTVGGYIAGIIFRQSKNATITGNEVHISGDGNGGPCVSIQGAQNVTVSGNMLKNETTNYGIQVDNNSVTGIVTGNMVSCKSTTGNGVYIQGSGFTNAYNTVVVE